MQDWLLWFLLAIGLFVGEMFTAGFWLACLAVGAGVAGLVGLIPGFGFVTEGIGPGVPGRVKVEGEDWRGASSDATVIEPGTQVTVIQVDGTTLMVEKEL